MKSMRNRSLKKRNTNKKTKRNNRRCGGGSKKWTTAIDAAQASLKKTGSLKKAKTALRVQALSNARKLFGSIGK